MEKSLQTTTSQVPGILSTLSDREKAIAKKLLDINIIVGYELKPDEIGIWAKELERLLSNDDLRKLPYILDCFKTTRLEYNNNLGIRNIFLALKEIITDEDGIYKIRSQQRY